MSQLASNDLGTPAPKGASDDFGILSEGDTLDSLDLTKPIKKADDKKEDEDKLAALPEVKDEEKEEEEEEDDPLAEFEEDLADIPADKLELMTPVKRREILAAYPDLFKKFPYLERAYYREQQFTEIAGTVEEAKKFADDSKILERYTEDMVGNGNIHNVLKMIKDSNPDTFAGVVDNYLEHLKQVDNNAYHHVTSNFTKNIILGLVQEAKDSGDDDFKVAASLLNKWAFGGTKFTPPERLSKEKPKEEKEKDDQLSAREREFFQRQIDVATENINTRVNNSIRAHIDQNIDPKNAMGDYVKRNAVRDAVENMTRLMDNDKRFQSIVERLWEKAAKSNFSQASQDEIRKAFLSKAKSLMEPVLRSSRNVALKGIGKKVKEDVEDKDEEEPVRERVTKQTEHRPSSNKKGQLDSSLRGKSSYEKLNALMGD